MWITHSNSHPLTHPDGIQKKSLHSCGCKSEEMHRWAVPIEAELADEQDK
jgi:hypothetical protein